MILNSKLPSKNLQNALDLVNINDQNILSSHTDKNYIHIHSELSPGRTMALTYTEI